MTELPRAPVVVVGERGVKLWRGLQDAPAPRPVLLRGLGGATVNDITTIIPELIGFIVPVPWWCCRAPASSTYATTNPPRTGGGYPRAGRADLRYDPARQIYIFSPIKNPLYPQRPREDRRATCLLRNGRMNPQVRILDPEPCCPASAGSQTRTISALTACTSTSTVICACRCCCRTSSSARRTATLTTWRAHTGHYIWAIMRQNRAHAFGNPVLPRPPPLLDRIDQGASPRDLNEPQLLQLAEELRTFLLYSVGQSGGHFGAGLGVVELTVALHHVFDTPTA